MHRILDPTSMGGLGLRRCQWTTTVLNAPSQNAAKRLGYTGEGVLRAIKVLQPGKEGFAGESRVWRCFPIVRRRVLE
jgi:RimJ/RimL family protein N-acetyltransferase